MGNKLWEIGGDDLPRDRYILRVAPATVHGVADECEPKAGGFVEGRNRAGNCVDNSEQQQLIVKLKFFAPTI